MKKVITSFSVLTTAEGENVAFTYSEIDDDGTKVKENIKKSIILVDDTTIENVKLIRNFLLEKV